MKNNIVETNYDDLVNLLATGLKPASKTKAPKARARAIQRIKKEVLIAKYHFTEYTANKLILAAINQGVSHG